MRFDREKVKQALVEWAHSFIALGAPAFIAFYNGIQVGDGRDQVTVFPDLSALKAFFAAALAAAGLGFLKAFWWYVTGTKVAR